MLKRWTIESKRCIRLYFKTKDKDHLKDIWYLTKFYIEKATSGN